MARTNGKSEVDPQELDATHELPASDSAEGEESNESSSSRASAEGGEL
jgi:hypothetical protein